MKRQQGQGLVEAVFALAVLLACACAIAEPAAVYVMNAMTGMSQNFFIVDFLFRVTSVAGLDTRFAC